MTADGFLDGLAYDLRSSREDLEAREDRTRRLASSSVRRLAYRHDPRCSGHCRHRNHQRDHEHLTLLLEALELDDTTARPDDYDQKLAWHSITREDAALLSGKITSPRAA